MMHFSKLAILLVASVAVVTGSSNAHADAKRTVLLFSFVTNQSGFDTGITIANTTADPFGSGETDGTCTLHYFPQSGAAPASQTTTSPVAAGRTLTFTLSSGGGLGIAARAGFQGYIIADCGFPFARGFGFLSDLGARNLAASLPVEVIPARDRK